MTRHLQRSGCQKGFGLIEVLAALLILAVGLLGMLAMQARGLQYNQAAYYQSQAMFMAEDIVERVRANLAAAQSYDKTLGENNPAITNGCGNKASPCSDVELAAEDLAHWLNDLENVFPGGDEIVDGEVEVNLVDGLYELKVLVRYKLGETDEDYELETKL